MPRKLNEKGSHRIQSRSKCHRNDFGSCCTPILESLEKCKAVRKSATSVRVVPLATETYPGGHIIHISIDCCREAMLKVRAHEERETIKISSDSVCR